MWCLSNLNVQICKYLYPKPRKEPSENFCNMYFKNESAQFINIARILGDSKILKSFSSSSLKCPVPMVTYNWLHQYLLRFYVSIP